MADVVNEFELQPVDVEASVEGTDAAAPNGSTAEQDPEARYRYDDSLLIRGPKGNVKRPSRPNEQERNLAVEKLNAEIDKHSARIKEIKELVEAARSARNAGQSGNQEIVRRVQGLRQEFQTVLRQKAHIREELQQVIKQKEELRAASRQLRDKLPKGVTADTIDVKIAELEYKMAHEGGVDDKLLFKRITDLKSARPAFKEYADVERDLKVCEDCRAEIQHRLQQCDAVLTDVKAREDAERSVLDQARNKQSETELDVPTLNVEKQECWDIIQALRAKRDEIRKDFQERYTEYIKLDRNYSNYMRSVKRAEYLERQKARAEREAEENGVADVSEPGPSGSAAPAKDTVVVEAYAAEVLTLDQLLTHLRKLAPTDGKTVAQEEKKDVEVPKGMKLLKKNDNDEGFMPIAAKKKNGGKKGVTSVDPAPPSSTSTKAPEPVKKKLNHTLEALKTFMQFEIDVPQSTAELPATIDKAVAKKEYYLELRRTGKKHVPKPKPALVAPVEPDEASTSTSVGATDVPTETAAATSNGSIAHAPAVEEQHSAGSGKAKAGPAPAEGLGLSLAVDDVTESVSIKLKIADV